MQHKAISQEKWVNLCVCIDVERQLLLHPRWRHSSMGIFFLFVLFCQWQQQWFKGHQREKRVSCSHQEWAWVLHLGFCTHSAGLGGRAHFLAPLLLVPDQRWCGASQHQCLRSSTSDRNWCCWCSSRGCNAVLQYQANGKNRDTQDYCAMDL